MKFLKRKQNTEGVSPLQHFQIDSFPAPAGTVEFNTRVRKDKTYSLNQKVEIPFLIYGARIRGQAVCRRDCPRKFDTLTH
jgi:hypothetical protein